MRAALLALAVAACAPPQLLPDLSRAEAHVHAGEHDEALAAYDEAIVACQKIKDPAKRIDVCGQAREGRAELLDRLGQRERAADEWEAMPAAIERDPDRSGKALYRAGRIHLELGNETRGYELLWRAVTEYPDSTSAELALRLVHIDGRRRNAKQLYDVYAALYDRLDETELGDNLLFNMAELAETELGDATLALSHYDAIASRYPKKELFDDSLWHGARLCRSLGDAAGAVKRYRALLDSREVAWFTGSYNSEWHDNSQLELGIVYRDDLAKYGDALKAFQQVAEDYPKSILLDDATFERAVTYERMGKPSSACESLRVLHKRWPDSKYELERAPEMRKRLSCASD